MTSFFECNFVVLFPSKFVDEKSKTNKNKEQIREIPLSAGIISMEKMRRRRWWRGKDARIATWCPLGIFSSFVVFVVFISQKATWDDIRSWVSKDFKTLGRAFHHQAFPLPKVFPSRKGILLSSITFHIKIRGGGGEEKKQIFMTSGCFFSSQHVYLPWIIQIYIYLHNNFLKKKKEEGNIQEWNEQKKNVYVVFYKI